MSQHKLLILAKSQYYWCRIVKDGISNFKYMWFPSLKDGYHSVNPWIFPFQLHQINSSSSWRSPSSCRSVSLNSCPNSIAGTEDCIQTPSRCIFLFDDDFCSSTLWFCDVEASRKIWSNRSRYLLYACFGTHSGCLKRLGTLRQIWSNVGAVLNEVDWVIEIGRHTPGELTYQVHD